MAQTDLAAMDLDVQADLRILILLDITGSMGGEIAAVKTASAELVRLSGQEFSGIGLSIAIITFTEEDNYPGKSSEADGSGCFVTLAEFTSLSTAQQYINDIKLCSPPGLPHINAGGGDGEENQKAALYKMIELDPAVPTIAFLITDAPPHMGRDQSSTAKHERRWLEGKGLEPEVAADIFRTFAKVQEHFNDSLVLNFVAYNNASPEIYGNFAQQTGGMLMRPMSRSPAVLARGLTDVVRVLLAQMEGQPTEVQELEGFQLVDVSGLNVERQTEQDAAGEVRAGDSKAIFEIAMERMVAVAGSKYTRRAIGMTAPSEQLQFVWKAARYIFKASDPTAAISPEELETELKSLLQLRDSIIEQLPEEHKGHFTISEADIKRLAEEAKAAVSAAGAGGLTGSASVFSLETVGEALADDAMWEDWLAAVMRLLLGFPLTVQLPKDKLGNPDFMDCWSSVIHKLGIDRTSAADFMQLIGGREQARGFTDRGEYNGFLVVVEPSDKLASLVFRIASGTQVLNYVTGVLLGAPGFLPNMYAGIAASALLRLLSPPRLSEFEWSQAWQILHSLCTIYRNAARPVSDELKAGRANPADNPSKLLLAAIRCSPTTREGDCLPANEPGSSSSNQQAQALRLVLQEWLATLIQRQYGKSSPESDAAYLESLRSYIPLQLLGPVEIDPLQQLHPLEQPGVPDTLQPDYQDQVLQRLRLGAKGEEEAECDLPPHPAYAQLSRGAKRLLALLRPDGSTAAGTAAGAQAINLSKGDQPSGPGIETVWPEWEQGVLQALLLRWRTARYRSTTTTAEPEAAAAAAAKAEVTWEPVEVDSVLDLLLSRLREASGAQLQGYQKARVAAASQQVIAAAATVVLAHQHDAAAASAALQQLYLPIPQQAGQVSKRPEGTAKGPLAVIQGQQVYLQRNDVPAILEECLSMMKAGAGADTAAAAAGGSQPAVTADMLKALVLGDWCTQGAQALRRATLVLQLCQELGPDGTEMLDAIKAVELCQRTSGPNKNGHSSSLQYPGPDGYSEEYAAKRKAGLQEKLAEASECKKQRKAKKLRLYMESMRKFADIAAQAEAAAAGDGEKMKKVRAVLAEYSDAHQVAKLTARLKNVLGVDLAARAV